MGHFKQINVVSVCTTSLLDTVYSKKRLIVRVGHLEIGLGHGLVKCCLNFFQIIDPISDLTNFENMWDWTLLIFPAFYFRDTRIFSRETKILKNSPVEKQALPHYRQFAYFQQRQSSSDTLRLLTVYLLSAEGPKLIFLQIFPLSHRHLLKNPFLCKTDLLT